MQRSFPVFSSKMPVHIGGNTGKNAKRQGVCYAIDLQKRREVHWDVPAGAGGGRIRIDRLGVQFPGL